MSSIIAFCTIFIIIVIFAMAKTVKDSQSNEKDK